MYTYLHVCLSVSPYSRIRVSLRTLQGQFNTVAFLNIIYPSFALGTSWQTELRDLSDLSGTHVGAGCNLLPTSSTMYEAWRITQRHLQAVVN